MTTAAALLAEQPAAFWLALAGVLLAAAVASGRRAVVWAALATLLAAPVAAVLPGAVWAQAAAALLAAAAVAALAGVRRRRRPRDRRGVPSPAPDGEARLLGRTARTRAPFVAGEGEVEVDGRARPARTLSPDEFLGADALVRIVRVGEAALVVRPLDAPAG